MPKDWVWISRRGPCLAYGFHLYADGRVRGDLLKGYAGTRVWR